MTGVTPVKPVDMPKMTFAKLAPDQPIYLEWRWGPEDFADIDGRVEFPVDRLIRCDDNGVRVRLWHDDEGRLRLRIGAWGQMAKRTLRED